VDKFWKLTKWELKQIVFDKQFLFKIAIGMVISLLLFPFLIETTSTFTEDLTAPSLPFSVKLVKIAVVSGQNSEVVSELEKNSMVNLVFTDAETALKMLERGEIHGSLAITGKDIDFLGRNVPLSNLAEAQVRGALSKTVKGDQESLKTFQKEAIEPFIKSIISPFLLFFPLLLWCLPIIQSVSYDRENKMLEALYTLTIDRRKLFLAKVLANLAFAAGASAIWMFILSFFGLTFLDSIGVFVIVVAISLLIISLNGLVSTITSNVKNATLAAGITSSIVFSLLYIVSLLRISPVVAPIADLSPVTYVSLQVVGATAAFPFLALTLVFALSIAAIILSVAGFSAEKFAFSTNPGIQQLYEGMLEVLKKKSYAAIAMGFVAVCLTFPFQILALLTAFFLGGTFGIMLLILVAVEEVAKFIGIRLLKPQTLMEGIKYGGMVGLGFGLVESLFVLPFPSILPIRLIFSSIHIVFGAIVGAGVFYKKQYAGLIAAILLHALYNYTVIQIQLGVW